MLKYPLFLIFSMTQDLIPRNQRLLDELNQTEYVRPDYPGMVAFLLRDDITQADLQKLVYVYTQGIDHGTLKSEYAEHPVFRWVSYVACFESRGTILSHLSREEINTRVKANRASLLNKDTRYSPIR